MRRSSALALLCLLASACSRTVTEKEPNDDYTRATPISSNCKVKGTLSSAADVDWYKLDVAQDNGVLSAQLGGIRDVDFVLSVLDKDRQEIKRFDETGVGGDEEALDVGVGKGVYYIVLSNKNQKANNPTQQYVMTVKVEPGAGREREPNDTPLSANALVPGGVVRGHYYPSQNLLSGDTEQMEADWYRIDAATAGTYVLNIDVSEVPKIDPLLEIYDSNSYKIKEVGNVGAGQPLTLRDFGVKAPAQYTLRLRSRNRAANPDVYYELLTEVLPYEGKTELEPDDQRLDATPFKGDSITGHVCPAGDADWYKVTVDTETKQVLGAELSAVPGMDLELAVTDELGKQILFIDNMGKEQPEVLTGLGVTKGDYYLVVSEKTGKLSDCRREYTLTKTLAPWQPGLEYELNDSSRTPQAVKVGDSLDGYIAPKGDVDWYEFNVYKKGLLSIEVTGVRGVKLEATLFDQDYKELLSQTGPKPGDSVALEKELDAGTYSVRLRGTDPAQNNVRDKYTLRLKAR